MRSTRSRAIALIALACTAMACAREEAVREETGAEQASSQNAWLGTLPPTPRYEGPPARLIVERGASSTQFRWQVTVPTGGWSMDLVGTEPTKSHVTLKVVLTRPATDAIVTQALETLAGEYRQARQAFDTADLLIEILTDGEASAGDYRRAAVWADEGSQQPGPS